MGSPQTVRDAEDLLGRRRVSDLHMRRQGNRVAFHGGARFSPDRSFPQCLGGRLDDLPRVLDAAKAIGVFAGESYQVDKPRPETARPAITGGVVKGKAGAKAGAHKKAAVGRERQKEDAAEFPLAEEGELDEEVRGILQRPNTALGLTNEETQNTATGPPKANTAGRELVDVEEPPRRTPTPPPRTPTPPAGQHEAMPPAEPELLDGEDGDPELLDGEEKAEKEVVLGEDDDDAELLDGDEDKVERDVVLREDDEEMELLGEDDATDELD